MIPVSTFMILWLVGQTMATVSQDALEFQKEFKPFSDQLIKKNSLTYFQSCDYGIEVVRQTQSKALVDLLGSISPSTNLNTFKSEMVKITSTMIEVEGSYCNGYQNLACNQSGRCVCAALDESLGFKITFERDNDVCRIAEGSICVPEETIQQSRMKNPLTSETPKQDLKCAYDRACVIKSDMEECTKKSMEDEVIRMVKEHGSITQDNLVAFTMEKAKEGICICEAATTNPPAIFVLFILTLITTRSMA